MTASPAKPATGCAAASLRRALIAVSCPMPRDAAGSSMKKTSVLPISGWGNRPWRKSAREHPRFHNWYADVLETGLGLCCEETARLILTTPEPFTLTELPDCPDEAEEPDPFLTVLRTVPGDGVPVPGGPGASPC